MWKCLQMNITRPHWWFVNFHDDVIKWKHFPRYWPSVREIHRWPVNSPHKGKWRGALMFSLICARVNNREAGDLRRHRVHYDVIVMGSGNGLMWSGNRLFPKQMLTKSNVNIWQWVINWKFDRRLLNFKQKHIKSWVILRQGPICVSDTNTRYTFANNSEIFKSKL